jgi:hypothetical protein
MWFKLCANVPSLLEEDRMSYTANNFEFMYSRKRMVESVC